MGAMPNEPKLSKYVAEFFYDGDKSIPAESMYLKADNDSDAIAQANWLARHTCCRDFQVLTVTRDGHSVIYRASARAHAA